MDLNWLPSAFATLTEPADEWEVREDGTAALTRGVVRVEWTRLGEGFDGDFDPDDPDDRELLRFDINRRAENGQWEEVRNGSFCTHVEVGTPLPALQIGLLTIMSYVHAGVTSDTSIKRDAEWLSWMKTAELVAAAGPGDPSGTPMVGFTAG